MSLILKIIGLACMTAALVVNIRGRGSDMAAYAKRLPYVIGLVAVADVCVVLSTLFEVTVLGVLNAVVCLAVLAFLLYVRRNVRARLTSETEHTDIEKEDTNAVRR